jgi:hypothetical protein
MTEADEYLSFHPISANNDRQGGISSASGRTTKVHNALCGITPGLDGRLLDASASAQSFHDS